MRTKCKLIATVRSKFLVVASEKDSKKISDRNSQKFPPPPKMGIVIQGVASIGSVYSEIINPPLPSRDGCWWRLGNSSRKDLFSVQRLNESHQLRLLK